MKVQSKIGWKDYSLEEWLLFAILFSFCSPWVLWAYRLSSVLQYFFVLCAFVLFVKHGRFKKNGAYFVFFLLLLYFVILQFANTVHFSYIPIAIAFLLATKIKEKEGNNVIHLATNYLFISILIALPLWLIHQFVAPLPVYDIIDVSSWKSGDRSLFYENHIFFISAEGYEAMRFYSWYDEPGVLGTFAAFILWANKYDIKNYKILIIFLGALFTYSMAYYILTIVGWLLYSRKSIKTMIYSITVLFVVGYVLLYYLQDNLAFQQGIIDRVLNSENGDLDSRLGIDLERLWDRYGNSSNIIIGLGSGALEKYGGISKSYKCFLLELGYVGLFLVIISYLTLIKKKRLNTIFTLLLFLLSFLQRPQLYTSFGYIMFSCIVLKHEYENRINMCNICTNKNNKNETIRLS